MFQVTLGAYGNYWGALEITGAWDSNQNLSSVVLVIMWTSVLETDLND